MIDMFNKKSKSEYYQTLGRRRKSFFEFTDVYPGSNGKKMRASASYRKKQYIARTLIALGIILLIVAGFFVEDLLMDISELPYAI